MERRRRGGIYGEVSNVSLEASFKLGIRGAEEDGLLFEPKVPARVSLGGDKSKDIFVKIFGDGDCEGNEDMLAYC